MKTNLILEKTRELAKMLQKDAVYTDLMTAKDNNDNDTHLQEMIGSFNLKRMELNQAVNASERDEEKISKLDGELKAIYDEIMSNEHMLAFDKAKTAMDTLMNKITKILVGAANGEHPDLIDTESSCTGSCSSCSGCH